MRLHEQPTMRNRAERPQGNDFKSTPNTARTDKDLIVKDLFNVNNIETQQLHGQKVKLKQVRSGDSDTYNLLLTDYILGVKDVTISRTVKFPKPSLAGLGKVYVVKDISGSASATTITISPFDTETINGDTSDSLNTNFAVRSYFTDGTNWFTY